MAMIDTPRTAPFGAITSFRAATFLLNTVETVTTAVRARIEAARTAEQLSRLSPALLEDIGLTPADVDHYKVQFHRF